MFSIYLFLFVIVCFFYFLDSKRIIFAIFFEFIKIKNKTILWFLIVYLNSVSKIAVILWTNNINTKIILRNYDFFNKWKVECLKMGSWV